MKEDKKEWRNIFILLELPEMKRTKLENKRVKEFLKRKAELDKIEEQPCKNCGNLTPVPLDFCSSKCKEEFNAKEKGSNR